MIDGVNEPEEWIEPMTKGCADPQDIDSTWIILGCRPSTDCVACGLAPLSKPTTELSSVPMQYNTFNQQFR